MNSVRTIFLDRLKGGFDSRLSDPRVSWVTQTHGRTVWEVEDSPVRGVEGDALVTVNLSRPISVRSADCAPILLTAKSGLLPVGIGVVHAGWKGIVEGVIQASADALNHVVAESGFADVSLEAQLFPCIGPECYEFSESDLDLLNQVCGLSVVANLPGGQLALDMVAAVRARLAQVGIFSLDLSSWECTACHGEKYFSHRARRELGRMGLVAWLEDDSGNALITESPSRFGLCN